MKKLLFILIISVLMSNQIYFDSNKAYNFVLEQCSFGPRYPGSDGHFKCKNYLTEKVSSYCKEIIVDEHTIVDPLTSDSVKIYNIFGRIKPELKKRVLFMAHWDTRQFADKDPDPLNHKKPVLGANDGASGVAVLLTLMDYFSKNSPANFGIDFLLTDAEDMGQYGQPDTWAIGAKLFSESYKGDLPQFAICVDMVGDKNLEIKMEQYSYKMAPYLINHIWSLASSLGYSSFLWEMGSHIIDDHVAFSKATQVPSIDIIDLDYIHWHTIKDTPDNVSQHSLEIVGNVLIHFINNLDKNE